MARTTERQAEDLHEHLRDHGLKDGSLLKRVRTLVANAKKGVTVSRAIRKGKAGPAGKTGRAKAKDKYVGGAAQKRRNRRKEAGSSEGGAKAPTTPSPAP